MYFATAQIHAPFWLPPLVAFSISLCTSMGGISGAFLLLPFQVSVLGYTAPGVSATNQVFNVVAIPSGIYRFVREGRMVWPLTWAVILGTLPGTLAGAVIRVRLLPDNGTFKVFAGLVLLYIGSRLALDLRRQGKAGPGSKGGEGMGACTEQRFGLSFISYRFQGQVYQARTWVVMLLAAVVGVVGGVYGVGGGAIIAPFFVTYLRLPVHTVAGATLCGTFITSVVGVGAFQVLSWMHPEMNVAPDLGLGLMLGLGGALGMYCGARLQKHVPARAIKALLCGVILFTALKYLVF